MSFWLSVFVSKTLPVVLGPISISINNYANNVEYDSYINNLQLGIGLGFDKYAFAEQTHKHIFLEEIELKMISTLSAVSIRRLVVRNLRTLAAAQARRTV